ncbi:hypothetical protein M885DRAFT_530644 [Pelagophyceae sp. CCMP2097]|nr:hypothetical protein M885DRAFT_530644 [Pelagophyceae sp. CCMP2097]
MRCAALPLEAQAAWLALGGVLGTASVVAHAVAPLPPWALAGLAALPDACFAYAVARGGGGAHARLVAVAAAFCGVGAGVARASSVARLGALFVAHVLLAAAFLGEHDLPRRFGVARRAAGRRRRRATVVAGVAYGAWAASLYGLLYADLSPLPRLALALYALALVTMATAATLAPPADDARAARLTCAAGGLLFVFSDTALALHRLGRWRPLDDRGAAVVAEAAHYAAAGLVCLAAALRAAVLPSDAERASSLEGPFLDERYGFSVGEDSLVAADAAAARASAVSTYISI